MLLFFVLKFCNKKGLAELKILTNTTQAVFHNQLSAKVGKETRKNSLFTVFKPGVSDMR
jgi:hypothetical protein